MMKLKILDNVFKFLKNTSFYFLLFWSISITSQNQSLKPTEKKDSLSTEIKEADLLKNTKDFIAKKEYNNALLYISKYYDTFSENLSINWLYAHVLYLNNDKKNAESKFKKAISISPKNTDLQLDYARILYEMEEINKAETILSNIDDTFKSAEFLLMQANISFWKGDVVNAQKNIDKIQKKYPNTAITKNLTAQIKELTAYYIKVNFEHQSDSQPLNYFANHIALGHYESKYLNPKLEISSYHFSPQKEVALTVKLSNQFNFNKLKLITNITGGVYKNISGEADWLGGIKFIKKITKNTSLNLGYSKNNVLGTIASTSFNLTNQTLFGEIDYNNKLVVLHAGYNQEFYTDDNTIKSFGSWIVSQPIKIQKFNFQFGYGYGYTDSEKVLFIYDDDKKGIYDPYFTPKEQEIHAALLILNYNLLDNLTFEAKGNYGWATVRNPYPNEYDNEIGGFYDETFTPLEFNGSINYMVSDSFKIKSTYTYQETFFYKRNNFNLGLNYTF